MTEGRRQQLRSVMAYAWREKREYPIRSFADCLRAAWAKQRGHEAFFINLIASGSVVGEVLERALRTIGHPCLKRLAA